MSRLPYAAKQLIKEVDKIDKDAVVAVVRAADGLGVCRTIGFDSTTAEWLEPALQACQDPRIVGFGSDEHGLLVTFTAGIQADNPAEFRLAAADAVLRGDTDD